ncbi:unnamed protein product, partial [Coregonus sp. 'balchen']
MQCVLCQVSDLEFKSPRPKSSPYCQQRFLNNLTAFIVLSFMATSCFVNTFLIAISYSFAVTFMLIDPVPQSFRAAYHWFGLVYFGQGLCTINLPAQQC